METCTITHLIRNFFSYGDQAACESILISWCYSSFLVTASRVDASDHITWPEKVKVKVTIKIEREARH